MLPKRSWVSFIYTENIFYKEKIGKVECKRSNQIIKLVKKI